MDHVVYVDAKSNDLEKLLDETKTMIIRGAAGRKLPYGRVNSEDVLYFINNNGEGKIRASAIVKDVFNSDKMTTEESTALVEKNQSKLQMTDKQFKRWAGKKYIVLIEVENIQMVKPFEIDKSDYGNMDDWLAVQDITTVRL